jgi:hypothetical protein
VPARELNLEAGALSRRGDRAAGPPGTDRSERRQRCAALSNSGLVGVIPFQFPHRRYQTAFGRVSVLPRCSAGPRT